MTRSESIRIGTALPRAGMPSRAPQYDYSHLIGRRVELLNGDHNANLERRLPRHGVAVRQVALEDWGSDWLVVKLDEALELGEVVLPYVLVRGRWLGCPVGSKSCPVFVLTDPRRNLDAKDAWRADDFDFIGWAEVQLR